LFGYDIKGELKHVAYTQRVSSHMPNRDHEFVGLPKHLLPSSPHTLCI